MDGPQNPPNHTELPIPVWWVHAYSILRRGIRSLKTLGYLIQDTGPVLEAPR